MCDNTLRKLLAPIFPNVDYSHSDTEGFVQTHCLYFDGSNVAIEVQQYDDTKWKISDRYSGYNVLRDHFFKVNEQACHTHARPISKRTGCCYHEGEWSLIATNLNQIIASILNVAYASQLWTEKMVDVLEV